MTAVKTMLHVADPMVVRMIGMRIVDHATGKVTILPTLNTPFWEAQATAEGYSVVVVLDPKSSRRGGIKDLPSSEWVLDIITDEPVQGLSTDVKKNPFLQLKVHLGGWHTLTRPPTHQTPNYYTRSSSTLLQRRTRRRRADTGLTNTCASSDSS